MVTENPTRGPKGDKGDDGVLARPVRKAIVWLFVVGALIAATNILFTVAFVHATQNAAKRQAQAQEAEARRQGLIIEQKLCTTMDRLAARKPPAGKPSDKSRTYLAWQHDTLAQLGPDIGCDKIPRKSGGTG